MKTLTNTHVNGIYNSMHNGIFMHEMCIDIPPIHQNVLSFIEKMEGITLYVYPEWLYPEANGFVYPNRTDEIFIADTTISGGDLKAVETLAHEYQHILQMRKKFLISNKVIKRPDQAIAWLLEKRSTYKKDYLAEGKGRLQRMRGYLEEIDATCAGADSIKRPVDTRAVLLTISLAINLVTVGILTTALVNSIGNTNANRIEQVK